MTNTSPAAEVEAPLRVPTNDAAYVPDRTSGAVPPTGRVETIEVAKGIGILLVVIGHLVAVRAEGPANYAAIKGWIYLFHMPFFMALSGFAFDRFMAKRGTTVAPAAYVLSRADRLLVPFAFFGIMLVLAKAAASHMVAVSDYSSPASSVRAIFVNTHDSPVISIWYVFVLFWYSLLTFAAMRMLRAPMVWLLPIAVLLQFAPSTEVLYLDRFAGFYVYFLAGIILSRQSQWLHLLAPNLVPLGFIFLASSTVAMWWIAPGKVASFTVPGTAAMLTVSAAAIPFLLATAMRIDGVVRRFFLLLGNYSMAIYLMNTLAIGGARIFAGWAFHHAFPLYALVATIMGVGLPILAVVILERVLPFAAKYVR